MDQPKIAVLMTSHNRAKLTIQCVDHLLKSASRTSALISIFLVDAGSTDGTSEMVLDRYPDVNVVRRDNDVYWNMGMRHAWISAIETGVEYDFYLWLNDDLAMRENTIANLLVTYFASDTEKCIVVGKTIDPSSGLQSYGGYRRKKGISRIRWERPSPADPKCDTMNGNCVLIPALAVRLVGINSQVYSHAFGDIDYGLRAKEKGFTILECDEAVGAQERNLAHIYTGAKVKLEIKSIKAVLTHPKGMPIGEWLYFCVRHAGILWPLNFLSRYLGIFTLQKS